METVVDKVAPEYTLPNILSQRLQGKSLQEVGDIWGVSGEAIRKKLKRIYTLIDKENLEAYKANKVNIFNAIEVKLLEEAIQPSKLKKLSTRDAVISFGVIHDKNRLEQGLSTENVAIQDVSSKLSANARKASDQLAQLQAELDNEGVNNTDIVDK